MVKVLDVGQPFGQIFINFERKKIKNVHLKIYRDLSVRLSAPMRTSDAFLNEFLLSKRQWILEQLLKFSSLPKCEEFVVNDGAHFVFLGEQIRVEIKRGSAKTLCQGGVLTIFANDLKGAQSRFESWWKRRALEFCEMRVNRFFDEIFGGYGLKKPEIAVRKMKSVWGNCKPTISKVAFNFDLFKAPVECVEYVILHELTHLIFPNHNAEFYRFLAIYMPDFRERKKKLNFT